MLFILSDEYSDLADDLVKNTMPSYFNLPPLAVNLAFPQATPASTFPPSGK